MNPKDQIALELTTALITADPTLLKGNDPQLIERRVKAALDLYVKVSEAVRQRFDVDAAGKD